MTVFATQDVYHVVVKDLVVNTLDPDELSLQLKREMIEYPSRVGWCVPTDVFAERGQPLPKNNKEVSSFALVTWVVIYLTLLTMLTIAPPPLVIISLPKFKWVCCCSIESTRYALLCFDDA